MDVMSMVFLAFQDVPEAPPTAAFLPGIIIGIISIVSMWMIFTKAGKPGWASIIPIYNVVVLLDIVGRPVWWILLLLIPFVNIIAIIIIYNDLSKAFGKGVGFTVGLILLSFIFLPMLAFGDAQYGGKMKRG